MSLTVEWVDEDSLQRHKHNITQWHGEPQHVPVIRVAELRAWLERERDTSIFADERGYLNSRDLLAQLPEEEA